MKKLYLLLSILLLFPAAHPLNAQQVQPHVPTPQEILGFNPGDDRRLASWTQVIDYYQKLDNGSDRVKFEVLGESTMGAPFIMVTISSPENLARLPEYLKIQKQLADPRLIEGNRRKVAEKLIATGKTIVLITCGVHSTEVGSYLSGMLIAHRLASSHDPEVQNILHNCIVLLVPSLNPDGVDIVKNWYDKTLGTPFEGTSPPELYHKYTGHDNNRDWYAFTQVETQITVDKIHNIWHPQIVNDIHQQGAYGARIFVPPYTPPVEPNVPKKIVEAYTELGRFIASEMRSAGLQGVTTDSTYDAWTPARAYSHYHGGVRILTETASARLASPLNVPFENLQPGLGYDARKASTNFPDLWPGGEWRLRDITKYMTSATFALLKNTAHNRERWLRRFYEISTDALRPRKKGEVFAFIIPPTEQNENLYRILSRGGVQVDLAEEFIADAVTYPKWTRVIKVAQPYGGFAKTLLEAQHYPDLRDKSGKPIPPYDVTAHTLPLLMNIAVKEIHHPFKYTAFSGGRGYGAGGGNNHIQRQVVALYRSFLPSMDEGWTRWVIENLAARSYDFIQTTDKEIRAGNLRSKFAALILPDQSPRATLNGHAPGSMPSEYTGGIGADGVKALREFVEEGGRLICLNRASDFAIDQFQLPVRDVTEGLKQSEFYCPGSILRVLVDRSNPIAAGMPEKSIAWFEDSPAFEITDNQASAQVKIIARYPEDKDPLLSGWLLGGEKLKGKAALVEVTLGKGKIILFGFRPQYRGQSVATYPLFFNSIK